jgi:hypothetical protein
MRGKHRNLSEGHVDEIGERHEAQALSLEEDRERAERVQGDVTVARPDLPPAQADLIEVGGLRQR